MWCSNCHQDTPGIAHAATGKAVCSQCQRPRSGKNAVHAAQICDEGIALDEPGAAMAAAAPPIVRDDWPSRRRVLDRELRRSAFAPLPNDAQRRTDRSFEPPGDLFAEFDRVTSPAVAMTAAQSSAATKPPAARTHGRQILAWLIVIAGAFSLTAGIGLLVWSLSSELMVHWNLALGLTLGGQGTLILGLVLVVARLWRNSRFAAAKLHDVHAQLGELQQTADAISSVRTAGAPSFYADLARGSNPHVLLANLKGQVDQLAARIGG